MNTGISAVHIALGASPSGGSSLESEMRLLKPALLYGDRVTLISPKATFLSMAAGIGELGGRDRLEFLRQVLPVVHPIKQLKSTRCLRLTRH